MAKTNILLLIKTSWRRLLKTRTKDVFRTSWRRLHQDQCLLGYNNKLRRKKFSLMFFLNFSVSSLDHKWLLGKCFKSSLMSSSSSTVSSYSNDHNIFPKYTTIDIIHFFTSKILKYDPSYSLNTIEVRNSRVTKQSYAKWLHTSSFL